jgi:hypothetical protein
MKEHASGCGSGYPSPGQLKELFAQVESSKITSRNLQLFLNGKLDQLLSKERASFEDIKEIMGDDFIFPGESNEHFFEWYTRTQHRMFKQAFPTKRKVEWLKNNNYMLIAGPPHTFTVYDLQKYFQAKEIGELEIRTKAARSGYDEFNIVANIVQCGWYEIKKTEFLGSRGRSWDDCVKELRDAFPRSKYVQECEIPNIAEAIWAFTIYKKARGVNLLPKGFSLMTSTTINNREHVCLSFDSKGNPVVTSIPSDQKNDKVGIAVCSDDI